MQPFKPQDGLKGFFVSGVDGLKTKGMVIAAAASGSGKTTVTLALLAALKMRGISVAPFKVGPDFIDPGHHTRITGRISRNLDGWMLPRSYNQALFARQARGCDVAVVEGVMGLFDGYEGSSEAGSSAQMAKWLGLPVLLVVNGKSMARSAAALVQGFERFDPDLSFAGVFFNQLGSGRHLSYLRDALDNHIEMPCLGGMIKDPAIEIPERHLGLVTEADHPLSDNKVERLARLLEGSLDIDGLLAALPEVSISQDPENPENGVSLGDVRIGVARDNAFCFYYQDNLDLLAANGAELVYFSPVRGDRLPDDIHGLYFGGGYPELFAPQLAQNENLRSQVYESALNGMPIYGECGGFMYLGQAIWDLEGRSYPMSGCFPLSFKMLPRRRALGYREVTCRRRSILGPAGQTLRGHEFHYSDIVDSPAGVETVYTVTPRKGGGEIEEGYFIDQCLGSYIHLHFGSCPSAAGHFVARCRRYQSEKGLLSHEA